MKYTISQAMDVIDHAVEDSLPREKDPEFIIYNVKRDDSSHKLIIELYDTSQTFEITIKELAPHNFESK